MDAADDWWRVRSRTVDGKFDVDASASEKEHDNGEQDPVVFRICGQGSSGSTALMDEDWHGVGPEKGTGFNVELQALPMDGRIVLMPPPTEEASEQDRNSIE
jgi:hypothetical protein